MCPHCRAFITSDDKICPYCESKVGPRAIDRRMPGEILGGLIPHARFTTVIVLTVNFGLYLATVIYSIRAGNPGAFMGLDGRTVVVFGAMHPGLVAHGEWWRLITAGFLHGGLMHILMNSWALFDLGTQVEELYGTSRLIILYFVSTVTGFLASFLYGGALSVGASAAIFGLIGAMIIFGWRHRSAIGDAIRRMYVRWAIYGLAFGLMGFLPIDNAAHIGGLLGGLAGGLVVGIPQLVPGWRDRLARYAAIACLTVTVLAFAEMFRNLQALPR